jgi:trigger factor
MQIQSTAKEGLKQEFKITIPSRDIDERVVRWLQDRSKTVRLDGFRPGKVPVNVLRQRFGSQALQDTIEHFVQKSTQQIYKDHNIRIAGQPTYEIETVGEGKDFSFSISMESLPSFKLKDFSHIELERLEVDVSAQEIEKALLRLAETCKKFEPAKESHKASLEDQVKITMGIYEGGKVLKGYNIKEVEFVIEDIPDDLEIMQHVLIGRKKHEIFEVEEKIKENHLDKKLVGKTVVFKVEILEISSPIKSKVNDAFAKEFGCENLADLREKVKNTLNAEYNKLARIYYKRHLLDALAKEYAFELPNNMVKNEFNNIWKRLEDEMANAKERGELTAEEEAKPLDSYEDEYKKIAERRVRLGLVVAEVARENNIHLTADAVKNLIIGEAMRYPGEEKQVVEFYRSHPEMIEQLSGPALEDKVIDFILTKVKYKNVKLTYAELKKKLIGILPNHEDDSEEEVEAPKTPRKTEKNKTSTENRADEEKTKKTKKKADNNDKGKSV